MKHTILFLALIFVSTLQARETDQYMVWDVELPDSSALINDYLQKEMNQVLATKNIHEKSCQQVTRKYFHRLVGTFTFSRFSLWAQNSREMQDYRYPGKGVGKLDYASNSIFGGKGASPIIRWLIGLAPSINVNGVYFGTDKLGHISYMGNKYYKKYLKLLKRGKSADQAVTEVLEGGFSSEVMLGGFYGTSSPSDLEANYQGLKLALEMCDQANPILSRSADGGWQVNSERLRIENYVTPEFDESYYPIIFGKKTWKQSAQKRIETICRTKVLSIVKQRFHDYRTRFTPGRNVVLMQSKMQKDNKFNNQAYTYQNVCHLDF